MVFGRALNSSVPMGEASQSFTVPGLYLKANPNRWFLWGAHHVSVFRYILLGLLSYLEKMFYFLSEGYNPSGARYGKRLGSQPHIFSTRPLPPTIPGALSQDTFS